MEQSVITHRRNVHPAAEAEEAGARHLRHRRDETVRYARGGPVYATDGQVGQLRNVVVDEVGGQVEELVITLRDNQNIVMPVDIVGHTAGDALFLTETRAGFRQRIEGAPAYERRDFARVNTKKLLAAASQNEERRAGAVVAKAGEDFIETPGSQAPVREPAPAG